MLAIEVAFLTGRYVATAYNSRQESEWPPHPARLFSAMVATHFASPLEDPTRAAAEREVLEWIEALEAPSIVADTAAAREVVTVFVPVNDSALTDVDDEAAAVERARAAVARAGIEPRSTRAASTALARAEQRLTRAIGAAIAVPNRPQNPVRGSRVLPDGRVRQPRTFPSVTPATAQATYVWNTAVLPEPYDEALDTLLRRVVCLGHSSSLVALRRDSAPKKPTWTPAPEGPHTLRVVARGQLAALEEAYGRHRGEEPRVMPFVPVTYSTDIAQTASAPARSVWSDEWLVLRKVGGPFLPVTATAGIARAVRRTLMSYADEPIPEMLSGHTADGRSSEQRHLALLPLPFVGHANASGGILGVALVLPRDTSAGDRAAVFAAVSKWEASFRSEDEDTPQVQLNLGAAGKARFERIEWGQVQWSLRPQAWCAASRVWSSVTPVALDRNPGDLHSRNPTKAAAAMEEARQSIDTACARIGLPAPSAVEILPHAPWAGAAKARHYPAFPRESERTQRVLAHVRIEFSGAVRGPVVLGAGRYSGLGLLRPELG